MPCSRAMPSPTETTVPTSATLTSGHFAHYLYENSLLLSSVDGAVSASIDLIQ